MAVTFTLLLAISCQPCRIEFTTQVSACFWAYYKLSWNFIALCNGFFRRQPLRNSYSSLFEGLLFANTIIRERMDCFLLCLKYKGILWACKACKVNFDKQSVWNFASVSIQTYHWKFWFMELFHDVYTRCLK